MSERHLLVRYRFCRDIFVFFVALSIKLVCNQCISVLLINKNIEVMDVRVLLFEKKKEYNKKRFIPGGKYVFNNKIK